MNKLKNWNCDGDRCREPRGEVRVYPLGGGANLILCAACVVHENQYRLQRARETGAPELWPPINWLECKPYDQGEKA